MAPRPQFQAVLEDICELVYFQPPEDVEMEYPCIVYRREPGSTTYADNIPYSFEQQYEVTLITRDPDDPRHLQLAALRKSRHARHFVVDNLNHDAFTIYF
jgi:hypothetical protein